MPSIVYYHLTQKPLLFHDINIRQFHTKEYRPVGLYYTQYPHLMPSRLYTNICSRRTSDSKSPCYLYRFTIPAKYITTDVKKPHPLKILRITKENWLDVGYYMQTHSRAELFRDYAGLDADDIEVHTFLQRQAYTMESITHPSNQKLVRSKTDIRVDGNTPNRANLRWLFPHGFSGLALDTHRFELYPEACVWRASEWFQPELVGNQTNQFDDLLASWSSDNLTAKYDIQFSHYMEDITNWRKEESKEPYAEQPLFRKLSIEYGGYSGYSKKESIVVCLIDHIYSLTVSPWVSIDTLYTQFQKDTGSPCSIEDFRKYYCDDYPPKHITRKLIGNQLWVQWKLWIPKYTKPQINTMIRQTNTVVRWFQRSFPNSREPFGVNPYSSFPSSEFSSLLYNVKVPYTIGDNLREWVNRLAPDEQQELFKELIPRLFTQKSSDWVLLSDLYTNYTNYSNGESTGLASPDLFERLVPVIPEGGKIDKQHRVRWTEWVPKPSDSTESIRQCIQ